MRILVGAFIAVLALASVVGAQQTAPTKDFEVPKHGALRLSVPNDWAAESDTVPKPPAAAIHLRPKSGETFDVKVTAVWQDAKALKETNSESIKANVEGTAKQMLAQAVEKDAPLKEIKGTSVSGWYYSLTDRNPAPGEFKYMTQGIFLSGELLCIFTILHREAETPEVSKTLAIFAEAVHAK